MNKKLTVYLANLANTKFDLSPSTVPLEIGYIKAYAESQLSGTVDIKLHRTFESLYKSIQAKKPDIIGCSWYGWNLYLTVNALNYIKRNFPDIVTVVGGPNVPEKAENCLIDFKKFPSIDIMIPNEGEIPFANLLKVFQNGRESVFKTVIDGVFYLSDGEVIGKTSLLANDINIFPSPYLNGSLNLFLDSELMPILQTTRGCPFHCSFCVSAKDSWNRVRAFDTERVKMEIDYLEAKAKNRTIRFADENLGILPRDLEIAKFIAEKHSKTGYPNSLRVYTHKKINSCVKEIVLLLRDLIPMNISFQTLTESVLKRIKRQNINMGEINVAVEWAHKENINVATELIFGLPDESYKSFMDVINKLVELRFDSVSAGPLRILKETEISRPESIEKYGYKILYSIAERGYTKTDQFENIEIDAWASGSNTFTLEEYIKIRLFMLVYRLFMFWGYFKEMVYIWENRGLRITDVIDELLNGYKYPFFSSELTRLKDCLQDNLFKNEDEVKKVFSQRFAGNNQYISFMNPFSLSYIIKGEMIHSLNKDKMIDEVVKASFAVFRKRGEGSISEFTKEMQFAKVLAENTIIPFWEIPQETLIQSPYDLKAWCSGDYRGQLSKFRVKTPIEYQFKINSLNQYKDFIQKYQDKPFYIQSEFFFRTFRTNNIRRYMAPNGVEGV